jgi:hypothetical protein
MMAGIRKEPGPTARRVAAALKRIRHGERMITTAELSRRLGAIGYPIADTGITKAEQGTRRVDVDDLVPLALALGVTPNVLLMPPVSYFGGTEVYELTPAARGTAEELWHWAQGEKDIPVLADGAVKWLGDGEFPISEFPVRSRPYLTAPLPPGAHENEAVRDVIRAVLDARHAGASAAEVRRAVEMTLSIPVLRAVPEFRDRIWGPREKKEKK